MQLTGNQNYAYRIFTGITSIGLSAWFWSLLLGIIAEWRSQSLRLENERLYLAKLQTEVDSQVSLATQVEIEAFRTYLLANLRLNEKSDMAKVREELLAVVSGVIRPVVEQMLAKRTAVEFVDSDEKRHRVQVEHVFQYVSADKSINPAFQVIPALPSAIAAATVLFGYPLGFGALGAFAIVWPASLLILKYTVARVIDTFGPWVRLFGVLILAGVAAIPTVWLLHSMQPASGLKWAAIEFSIYSVITGLLLAMGNAYIAELTRVYRAREQYLKSIHWKVAEVNSRRWHQQLYFARRVHGALQSEVSAVAIRIEQQLNSASPEGQSVEEIRQNLQTRVENVFSSEVKVANPMEVLGEIAETWAGICQVSVNLGHDDALQIMRDPIAVETALEIIREGISNAIRHGNAEHVWVGLSIEGDDLVRVEVTNDGEPLAASDREGMGTKYLQECSASFTIQEDLELTQLIAHVPFRA